MDELTFHDGYSCGRRLQLGGGLRFIPWGQGFRDMASYGAEQMVEEAISERIQAINALVKAIKEEPRRFQ